MISTRSFQSWRKAACESKTGAAMGRANSRTSAILNAGADKVAINSAALKDPELLSRGAEAFGAQCIVLAIDAKRAQVCDGEQLWHVYMHGGRIDTGRDAIEWADEGVARGAGEI